MGLNYKGITYATTRHKAFIAIPLRTSLKIAGYSYSFKQQGLNESNCIPIFNKHYDLAKKIEKKGLEPIFVFEKYYEKDTKPYYFIIAKNKIDESIKKNEKGFIKSTMDGVYANINSNNCSKIDINDENCKTLLQTLFKNFKSIQNG